MNNERIRDGLNKLGKWTAHNIWIKDDIYTINEGNGNSRSKKFVQIVSDILDEPFSGLRVLDLACLEGLHAIEFARQGAEVVGIEGREENLKKARFVKEVLSLNNLEFFQDDVRNLSAEKYGCFDAVLCSGILYHLDTPDVFHFVKRMFDVCKKILILDTYVDVHTSWERKVSINFEGHKYMGNYDIEHNPDSTNEEKLKKLWYSLDNVKSFKFTRASLYNLMSRIGFTSLYECHNPPSFTKGADERITLLALKGEPCTLISSPQEINKKIHYHPEDYGYINWQKYFIRLEQIKESVIKRLKGKRVIIYGAGSASKNLYFRIKDKTNVVALVDRYENLHYSSFEGDKIIYPIEYLKFLHFDSILITPINQKSEIRNILQNNLAELEPVDILFIENILSKP